MFEFVRACFMSVLSDHILNENFIQLQCHQKGITSLLVVVLLSICDVLKAVSALYFTPRIHSFFN